MKILFFGDIVGKIGRRAIQATLPDLKHELTPDLVIANVENLAHGKGVTEETLSEMKEAGVDVFTSGNHIFKKGGHEEILESKDFNLIRPANYPPGVPGRGYVVTEVKDTKVAVINLMGRVFFAETLDDPLRVLDEVLQEIESEHGRVISVLDWHTEATSEKQIMGWYADGRLSGVLGTHTHVATADTRILPQGTAYVSDVGMTGARDAILGVELDGPMHKFQHQMPAKFEIPESGTALVNSVYLEIDNNSGKTLNIRRIDKEVEIA